MIKIIFHFHYIILSKKNIYYKGSLGSIPMIKISARNKFSKKTTFPDQPEEINIKKKVGRNRSSISINGKTFQDYFTPFCSYDANQNILVGQDNFQDSKCNINLLNTEGSYVGKKSQFKKSKSSKLINSKRSDTSQLSSNNIKFNKMISCKVETIKIQEEQLVNVKPQRDLRRSRTQTPQNISVRSSAIKKDRCRIKKTDSTSQNNLHKRVNILNQIFQNIGSQSEHYEEFLRESNLYEMTKGRTQTNQDQNDDASAENTTKLIEHQSKSYFERENLLKGNQQQNKIQRKKPKFQTKMIQSNELISLGISQNELQIPKTYENTHAQFFENYTQKSIAMNQKSCHIKDIKCNQSYTKMIVVGSSAQIKQQQLKQIEQRRIQQQLLYKQETEQLFRRLQREIQSKKQMQIFQKKSNNYYQALRVKLMKQFDKISKDYRMDDKAKDKIGLLIQGCNLQKHRRLHNFYFEKKQSSRFSRPGTPGAIEKATQDINRLSFVSKQRNKTIMRPQTSRPQSNRLGRNCNSNEKSSCLIEDQFSTMRRFQTESDFNQPNYKNLERQSECSSQLIFSMTNPDLKSYLNFGLDDGNKTIASKEESLGLGMKKKSKQQIRKQKQAFANKFQTLLNVCSQQNEQHEMTKKKMKAFEYYCSKMDSGFGKIAGRIKDYVGRL